MRLKTIAAPQRDRPFVVKNDTDVVISNDVKVIGQKAFSECKSLKSVVIPYSVTTIGSYAFGGCGRLTIYVSSSADKSGWDEHWKGIYSIVVVKAADKSKKNASGILRGLLGKRFK